MADDTLLNQATVSNLLRFTPDWEEIMHSWSFTFSDRVSGSQPSESGKMLARRPPIHANHRIWEPTPFISFTQSPQELQNNVNWRKKKRGSIPVLNMVGEMHHYGVPDPYDKAYEYYENHYICIWEVTEEEVVRNWEWDDLLKTDRWYEQVILPAFKVHNDQYDADSEAFKMSTLRDALSETQTCSEPEEYEACFSDESDSSDEVEANNATDDALKLLEEA
ncbi:hypothetical protein BDV26DRAFT_286704 [Aspergillus bertholletiae]|uniref:Uncharacterized protein n=1 Tax=Aspergillus bertholletiae TaxID=1226010 RepID=A0A5N7ANW2_9EURO|nr:hypothetical protein BDV26DRAFT_286704 [Aspergillus bertholletiae]